MADHKSKFVKTNCDGIGDYSELYRCLQFLSAFKPSLVATSSETIKKALEERECLQPHVKAWFTQIDNTENFIYQVPDQAPTRYFGGTVFSKLDDVSIVAPYWRKKKPILGQGEEQWKNIKSIIDILCRTNSGITIVDRTILNPLEQARRERSQQSVRDKRVFQMLQQIAGHQSVKRLTIICKSIPPLPKDKPDADRRKHSERVEQAWIDIRTLCEHAKPKTRIFALDKDKVDDLFESKKPIYELGKIIGNNNTYDWHHFSTMENNTPELYIDTVTQDDEEKIKLVELIKPDQHCARFYVHPDFR
ncbi:hypothetical protein OA099_04045 [Litorivicinus sp.]|nr:hypothetical protein [Litorivicinus sp.]